MRARSPDLAAFLTCYRAGLSAVGHTPVARVMLDRAFATLMSCGEGSADAPGRLPVCDYLPVAAGTARQHGAVMADIVDAFLAVEPQLHWRGRAGGPTASANFDGGHANAMIVGPGGLEAREDVRVGVSLLAPFVRYPDHTHPPEEIYLVLSPGRFRQENGDWFSPGIGGSFYNRPGILHAMASDAEPLLAIWCLMPVIDTGFVRC